MQEPYFTLVLAKLALFLAIIRSVSLASTSTSTENWERHLNLRQYSSFNRRCSADQECRSLRTCYFYIDRLQNKHQYPNIIEKVRESTCSIRDQEPFVCCPKSSTGSQTSQSNAFVFEKFDLRKYPGLKGQESCGSLNALPDRIVGGRNATLGAWPWMTALGYRDARRPNRAPLWLCGGALISARHVLTAAHCVNTDGWQLHVARLGDLHLNPKVQDKATPIDIVIAEKIPHPRYDPTTITNDIAVLRLSKTVEFTNLIQPICLPFLPEIRDKNFTKLEPYVIGWGATNFEGPQNEMLQEVQIPVVSTNECAAIYSGKSPAVIDHRVICAGFKEGRKDSCQGDSGGPFMYPRGSQFYLIGVVSFGYKCAEPGYPGVYSKVTSFMEWIVSVAK